MRILAICFVLGVTWAFGIDRARADVEVGDAYAQAGNGKWTIGTHAAEVTLETQNGKLLMSSFVNKLTQPAREYVGGKNAISLLDARVGGKNSSRAKSPWMIQKAETVEVKVGGRRAVQLDLTMIHDTVRVLLHVLAYPASAVFRQWAEIENLGKVPCVSPSQDLYTLGFRMDDDAFTNHWLVGGANKPDLGEMREAKIANSYRQEIAGKATAEYVPWMGFHRNTAQGDGCFVFLDYLGSWSLLAAREGSGPVRIVARSADLTRCPIAPGERFELPAIFFGVFHRDLDDLGQRLYDWQYAYMWDYTHNDWHALTAMNADYTDKQYNLQESFAGRLGYLDMGVIDLMRVTGVDMLWDDAGWSESPSVWSGSGEGPDFSQTARYRLKTGMKWLLWFVGRPTVELLDSKVGSWGDFQWRTDAVNDFDMRSDRAFRTQIKRFLDANPGSSFHTCSGGSTYSHTWEIQRYSDFNYLADARGGDFANYYLSYLETPDKWMDSSAGCHIMPSGEVVVGWQPETRGRILAAVPVVGFNGPSASEADLAFVRRNIDVYHYLLREGVAGRWSYMFHPRIVGDREHHYAQRTSHDRTKAMIILKHLSSGNVTIYPKGLLPDHSYEVGYESHKGTATRSGADLMANGIAVSNQVAGEMIYLGMPNRPGSGTDKTPPMPPSRVIARREVNIGHCGMGIYWSPGRDDNWVSYHEVRRGQDLVWKVPTGAYFFDHFPRWGNGDKYSVRTIDGDGNASDWTEAVSLDDEPLCYSALGGHSSTKGAAGWSAEVSADGRTFSGMRFVRPAGTPFVDWSPGFLGGSNQIGGLDGYWEEAKTARVGRGWQEASHAALCVRTWTAPQAGTVRVVGRAMKEHYRRDSGGPLRVRVLHGATPVWPQKDWAVIGVPNSPGCAHDFVLAVAKGDAIRFVLDKGAAPQRTTNYASGSTSDDIIAWMPTITYLQEPKQRLESVVRILCGSSNPYVDANGIEWSADQFFAGGATVANTFEFEGVTPTTTDQMLYRHGRKGKDFRYSIPVRLGLYAVRIKVAEPEHEWFFERPMNVTINNRPVLANFDVCHAARRWKRAYDRTFHSIVPDADGKIVLRFSGGWDPLQRTDEAIVQAIEVLPESKSAVRINCGSDSSFVDWNSCVWDADRAFQGGKAIAADTPVSQASPTIYDQGLYRTARAGKSIGYTISMPPGFYTVHLKFAELWLAKKGQRPMDIEVNGRVIRKSWDPATTAGRTQMAVDIRVDDIVPNKDGHIVIRISAAGANDAILQGIEVE